MLMRMFVANGVARLGGWLDWVAKTLPEPLAYSGHLVAANTATHLAVVTHPQ